MNCRRLSMTAAVAIMAAVFIGASAPAVGIPRAASAAAAVSAAAPAPAAARSASAVSPWIQIRGGEGTGCAEGAPFSFFVHRGDSRRLLVLLDGGGACWNSFTCVEHQTFAADVDSTVDPARLHGILALDRPENPFREFTVIRIPYCTGDVHLGAKDTTYPVVDSAGATTNLQGIHHGGNANVEDALGWLFRAIAGPSVTVVAGESAGGIATPFYAAELATHYPKSRVVSLSDGAGAYHAPSVKRALNAWDAAAVLRTDRWYRGVDTSSVTLEMVTTGAARGAPRVRFAQVNSAEDSTQAMFLKLLGVRQPRVDSLLAVSFREIRRSVPSLRAYTSPGPMHTVLIRPEFYELRVDGVALRDWVAALVAGKPVRNVGEQLLTRALGRAPGPKSPAPRGSMPRGR